MGDSTPRQQPPEAQDPWDDISEPDQEPQGEPDPPPAGDPEPGPQSKFHG